MPVLIIRQPATPEQLSQMRHALGGRVKVAVDLKRQILAGGGALHADCRAVLLESGSSEADVWGATWYPLEGRITFQSAINIRRGQNNSTRTVRDPALCSQIETLVRRLLEKGSGQP